MPGYNHYPDCTCGWCQGGGWAGDVGSLNWQYQDEDFCQPTKCKHCGTKVFFVRHNGGSVWFNELGWPWPKHECFDDDRYGVQLRRMFNELHRAGSEHALGVIIETEMKRPGERGRIVVRCSDGTLIEQPFDTTANLSYRPGRLVVVVHDEEGGLSFRLVNPAQLRTIAYLQIIENGTAKVIEEFAYVRKPEAEQRLQALQSQYPGKYRLQIDKRSEY